LRSGVNVADNRLLDHARDLQAGWVRATLRWSDMEPQPGAYQWSPLDTLIDGARSRGLRLLLVVTQSPLWAAADGGLPDRPDHFGAFMGALAAHADGNVDAYEIWHNPNAAPAAGAEPASPDTYAELLTAAYTAIKRADPCALVLNGALLPAAANTPGVTDDLAFYRGMLAANSGAAKQSYDILAVQLNTSGDPGKGHWSRANPSQSRGFYGHVNVVRDEMTAADQANKQIWIVQVGYSLAGEYAVAPEEQGQYLVKLLEWTRQSNPWISGFFAQSLGGAASADADFSLLNADGTPRAGYAVLRDYYAGMRAQREHAQPIAGTDLVLLWRYWPNQTPTLRPVIGRDGAIYTIDGGYIRVLDPNGAFRLSMKADRKNVPGLAVDAQQTIYTTGETGALVAYTSGGNFSWSALTDGLANTPLLISADGQTLYSGTSKRQLDAYATSDGHKLWGAQLGGDPGAPALGGDGTIYLGASEGALHAIAPDGTPRWSYPAGGFARAAPVVAGDTIYGVTEAGVAFALDTAGKQRWRTELGAPAVGLAVGDTTLFATTADGQLHALAVDGTPRWATQLGGGQPTAPAASPDGRAFVGAADGRFRVVAADGTIAGSFDLQAPLRIPPVVGHDGAVYVLVGDKRDAVAAFGTQALKARYNAP
jgi:outer membrane protein assembly factor BamB